MSRRETISCTCPYCGQAAELVGGDVIYESRPDLAARKFWLCRPCNAWVGTHANSPRFAPLGRLANAPLRAAKKRAHAAFDPMWEAEDATMNRHQAYRWLAGKLGIPPSLCHIGHFNESQCAAVVAVMKEHNASTL